MHFCFYQNIISIHQITFLSALAKQHSVTLVVERLMSDSRRNSGWETPEIPKAITLITQPSESELYSLFEQQASDVIHVFSGVCAFPMVTRALKIAKSQKARILVSMEAFRFDGWLGKFRYLKYCWQSFMWHRAVDAFLVMGATGFTWYRRTGIPQNKLFIWGYFTQIRSNKVDCCSSNMPIIIFIGSFIKRKNVELLLKYLVENRDHFSRVIFVGSGKLKYRIESFARQYPSKIVLLGNVPNNHLNEILEKSDLLILPSRSDGWGAVVNEALQCGTRVLASENCGASCLLNQEMLGSVFHFSGANTFDLMLKKELKRGVQTPEKRKKIMEWADKTISGEVAAEYFINICNHLYNGCEAPLTPWEANK